VIAVADGATTAKPATSSAEPVAAAISLFAIRMLLPFPVVETLRSYLVLDTENKRFGVLVIKLSLLVTALLRPLLSLC
jgi:hypothetical protein